MIFCGRDSPFCLVQSVAANDAPERTGSVWLLW